MAAHTNVPSNRPSLHLRPTVCIPDGERRRVRSADAEVALQLQLEWIAIHHALDLLVVADLDGAPVATAGEGDAAIELADFAARIAHAHPSWHSRVTSRGYVFVERIEVGLKRWCIAGQSSFASLDRAAIEAAAAAVERIAPGITVEGAAAMPLQAFGGWGDWDGV